MRRTALTLALGVAACLAGCGRNSDNAPKTPLPTRETTIDPVNKKLDAAAQEIERRRQEVDGAAK